VETRFEDLHLRRTGRVYPGLYQQLTAEVGPDGLIKSHAGLRMEEHFAQTVLNRRFDLF
jgi:hypothetical protein